MNVIAILWSRSWVWEFFIYYVYWIVHQSVVACVCVFVCVSGCLCTLLHDSAVWVTELSWWWLAGPLTGISLAVWDISMIMQILTGREMWACVPDYPISVFRSAELQSGVNLKEEINKWAKEVLWKETALLVTEFLSRALSFLSLCSKYKITLLSFQRVFFFWMNGKEINRRTMGTKAANMNEQWHTQSLELTSVMCFI